MARRLPPFVALAVLGVIAAAAAAGSASGSTPQVAGSFGTVPVPATTATTTAGIPSDDTVPRSAPVVTAPGPGVLPGFDADTFDHTIADGLMRQGAYAVEIAIAKDGHLVHEAAFGVADVTTGERVQPSYRFEIASNSKMLTSAVILQLVGEGTLSLEDTPLAKLAAQYGTTLGDDRMNRVTIRELLSHVSGLADFQAEFFGGRAVSCEDVTVQALHGKLANDPGHVVNYSNENFCLLGLLIEQVTGEGYEQAVVDRLLTPLGITDMRVTGNGDHRAGEVVHPGGDQRNFMEVLGGAGAWVATASDLVRIVDSFDTTRPGWHPITDELATQMRTPGTWVSPSAGQWFGLGLRVWSDGTWGHTGTVQNAHSMVLHRPDGYTWAVLVDGEAPNSSDDLREFVDRAFAATHPPLIPVQPWKFDFP